MQNLKIQRLYLIYERGNVLLYGEGNAFIMLVRFQEEH